jgi:hypothetical protein
MRPHEKEDDMNSTIATVAAAGQRGQFQPGQMMPGGQFPGGPGRFGGPPVGGRFFFGPLGGPLIALLLLVTLVVLAIAFWKVFERTGRSGALGLLMLIPVVNLGMALWAAFSEWPVEREMTRLRALIATQPPAPDLNPTTQEVAATRASDQDTA